MGCIDLGKYFTSAAVVKFEPGEWQKQFHDAVEKIKTFKPLRSYPWVIMGFCDKCGAIVQGDGPDVFVCQHVFDALKEASTEGVGPGDMLNALRIHVRPSLPPTTAGEKPCSTD